MQTPRIDRTTTVSVVVVMYNSEKTIAQTLDSILAQDHARIELLICDDASRDGTVAGVADWLSHHAHRFTRTRLLASPSNLGVRANLAAGYAQASGTWVKAIAGDDLLFPGALSRYLEAAAAAGTDLVVGRVSTFADGAAEPFAPGGRLLPDDADVALLEHAPREALLAEMARRNVIPAPGVFLNLERLRRLGGLDADFVHLEDWPLWMNFLADGVRPAVVHPPLVAYRVGAGSLSARRSATAVDIRYLKDLETFFRKYQARHLGRLERFDRQIELRRWRLAAGTLRSHPGLYKLTRLLHLASPLRWTAVLRRLLPSSRVDEAS